MGRPLRLALPNRLRKGCTVIVCHCAVVACRDITVAAERGASTLSQVCASTGAGQDCGACVFSVKRILCESVPTSIDPTLSTEATSAAS